MAATDVVQGLLEQEDIECVGDCFDSLGDAGFACCSPQQLSSSWSRITSPKAMYWQHVSTCLLGGSCDCFAIKDDGVGFGAYRLCFAVILGSAEALPILCVRYIRREREREKDGSDVTIVAPKLAMTFALLLAKNVHLSMRKSFALFLAKKIAPQFLPSWMALSSHFPLPKTLHFSKQFAFFALSNGVIDRGSKQQSERWNFRLHRSFSSKYRKNESN